MDKFESLTLFAFASIDDPAANGLPPEDHGMVMAAFMDNSDGERVTFLVSDDDSQILAQGAVELQGGFEASGAFYRKARLGWPEDWENPGDPSQWVTPEAGP